ncbi:uncharacterized protein MKK02DRAFT_25397 [Dioszegia hungarica]|uniref:RhoGAP-domain-containing protein n=1 Tax=Dioszegia hungarica TaxID=4972 RepID=A0AA38HA64_9TREE|nr:uncharacterized protein MKK02DRAFT_25397 [Dioszegia hungarica]KAI9636708.1 hypothetical protein MKK02DRAFT_25397 [Dioszegia hungarica]
MRVGRSRDPTYCGQCNLVVHGQFVRAMGKVYHLNCFRCKDCNKVVAQKFFPVEDPEGMYPLCERDYFARLDLICAKCNLALRSSYITACGEKYHVEHFTCSECDVVFGPNDSYYEHSGKVYCHFHYSTRFAVKCVGCETAILKQFVEMNRNGRDECWHPECYMISKFWNVRLASKTFNTPANSAVSSSVSLLEMTPAMSMSQLSVQSSATAGAVTGAPTSTSPALSENLGPVELKERQEAMETKVLQIWHVLSGYEESSAALIGEMLRAVNGRNLLEIVLLAERFILHVEALFAVIDDLEAQFSLAGVKGMSHAREAKQLCRKLVNLFSTMSQISPTGPAQPNNQDLYTLITQLAHYLKILIRIALTGAIKLEREQGHATAMINALGRLNLLGMDGSDPSIPKRGDYPEQLKRAIDALPRRPAGFIPSTQGIAYGYRSLAATHETTLRGPQEEDFVPPEGCAHCHKAIEEDCIRLGMFDRWHSPCVQCAVCGDRAVQPIGEESEDTQSREEGSLVPPSRPKRAAPRVRDFVFELPIPPSTIYCTKHQTRTSKDGFESVSRLEQYAFLLHIALRRLYVHFRIHHNLPSVRDHGLEDIVTAPGFDVKRMKSVVTLDRKLSSTARLPQRSTVVESPAGRIANEDGRVVSARAKDGSPPKIIADDLTEDDPPGSATVDVIRPAFARNNTSVMIVNDNNTDLPPEIVDQLQTHQAMQEDDAITLGDIPMLADQTRRLGGHDQSSRRPLLAGLNQLQSLILKHFALLALQKSGLGHLIELDEVLELLDVRKNQWWNKIFKGNVKDKQKKKGVFNVPLEILVERTGSDSQMGASNAQLRVPEFIEEMIATMRQMDMAVEGIFRKNGNIRRLQQISEALDKDSTQVNLSEENPVQLAALLKRFLRELPDPLLTFKLHKLFCAAASFQSVEERQRCLHLLICLLPRYNRDTMEVLFVFLKWVASFSYKDEETGSRMDLGNLATVICPSILYAKGANAARDESFIAITAVQDMLENQDEYYAVPEELRFVIDENIFNIFAKDLDLPPKEIHRHCSKYMQARGQPPTPNPGNAGGGGGGGSGSGSSRLPPSSSGQMRERPSDSRLSNHRSEGNLTSDSHIQPPPNGSGAGPVPIPSSHFRVPAPPSNIGMGISVPNSNTYAQHSSSATRPQSYIPSNHGSHWRGPFQGAGNGSRNSSRGSAPSSPGPDDRGRTSLQLDSEGRRTPVSQDHR